VIIIILAVALPLTLGTTSYECTVEDIWANEKVLPSVVQDIEKYNISMNDEICLYISVADELTDEETKQLDQIGVRIRSWSPPFEGYPTGVYTVMCEITKICQLADLDFVLSVDSGEGKSSIE